MLTYARVYESVGKAHAPIRIMLPPGLGEKVTWADTTAMGVYQILKDCLGVIPAVRRPLRARRANRAVRALWTGLTTAIREPAAARELVEVRRR